MPDTPMVLIAEDDPDMRFMVRAILHAEFSHLEVVAEAADGLEALTMYGELDQLPDLVVLDSRMPGLGGLEVAAEILERVPEQTIILFTAFVTPETKARGHALGLRAVVDKTALDDLTTVIREVLAERRQRRQSDAHSTGGRRVTDAFDADGS